jgi:hypothetical protein
MNHSSHIRVAIYSMNVKLMTQGVQIHVSYKFKRLYRAHCN